MGLLQAGFQYGTVTVLSTMTTRVRDDRHQLKKYGLSSADGMILISRRSGGSVETVEVAPHIFTSSFVNNARSSDSTPWGGGVCAHLVFR